MSIADGDLTLKVGRQSLGGWTDIRVTMGIERCPNNFTISMTEKFPDETDLAINPGDTCQVLLGSDLVITGYIDRVTPIIGSSEHTIQVTGRGKCQDLVDCSAIWPSGQISGSDALMIATKLAKPYDVKVLSKSDVGVTIPQFNIMVGESPYEILERVGRWRGFLAYELPDGSLLIARAGSEKMSSGIAEGKNVQAAQITYSMDQRYSVYRCFAQSFQSLSDLGDGGNKQAVVIDSGVPRQRELHIVAETGEAGLDIMTTRALWERARRIGRSKTLSATVDSWRDADGELWKPNAKIPVDLPSLKLPKLDWVIGQVSFARSPEETTAELTIMPRDAFLPESDLLQPAIPDVLNVPKAK